MTRLLLCRGIAVEYVKSASWKEPISRHAMSEA